MRGTPTIVVADTATGREIVKRGLTSGRDLDAAIADVAEKKETHREK